MHSFVLRSLLFISLLNCNPLMPAKERVKDNVCLQVPGPKFSNLLATCFCSLCSSYERKNEKFKSERRERGNLGARKCEGHRSQIPPFPHSPPPPPLRTPDTQDNESTWKRSLTIESSRKNMLLHLIDYFFATASIIKRFIFI